MADGVNKHGTASVVPVVEEDTLELRATLVSVCVCVYVFHFNTIKFYSLCVSLILPSPARF